MPNGILRIPEGVRANLPKSLVEELNKRFKHYQWIEFSSNPVHSTIYQKRCDSLYDAFCFLLEAYPPEIHNKSFQDLICYADSCKNETELHNLNLQELQSALIRFTASLLNIIRLVWGQSHNGAIELLNDAEQYLLMGKGRPHLATLSIIEMEENQEYLLQEEVSLPPYNEQIINELHFIEDLSFPKISQKMRELSETDRNFLNIYLQNNYSKTEALENYKELLEEWDDLIKGKTKELQDVANGCRNGPKWFLQYSHVHQQIIRLLAADKNNQERFLSLLTHQDTSFTLLSKMNKLPQWYCFMPTHQQFFLEHVLNSKKSIPDAITFLSSRHRTLPMLSNLAAHSCYLFKEHKFQQLGTTKYRSSHITPRDGLALHWPKSLLMEHASRNLNHLIGLAKGKKTFLLQTLISPIKITGFSIPDKDLDQIAEQVISQCDDISILKVNHPLNIAKVIIYTAAADPNCLAINEKAKKNSTENPQLNELTDDYSRVLNSGLGSSTICDYRGRELFLSSLEQLLIIAQGGFSYGSCVSGKDRKAIECIHTDAMLLCNEVYGFLPKFDDRYEARHKFIKLVAQIYLSRHHHTHAGQNAPGSEGIKTPDNYFPADISLEINNQLAKGYRLADDDRIASNNEVKNIFPKWSFDTLSAAPKYKSSVSAFTALSLGEEKCESLLTQLGNILQNSFVEDTKFYQFFSRTVPKGIQKMKEVLANESSDKSSISRLKEIFNIALSRPDNDPSRNELTISIYKNLRDLTIAAEEPLKLKSNELIEKIVQEWKALSSGLESKSASPN